MHKTGCQKKNNRCERTVAMPFFIVFASFFHSVSATEPPQSDKLFDCPFSCARKGGWATAAAKRLGDRYRCFFVSCFSSASKGGWATAAAKRLGDRYRTLRGGRGESGNTWQIWRHCKAGETAGDALFTTRQRLLPHRSTNRKRAATVSLPRRSSTHVLQDEDATRTGSLAQASHEVLPTHTLCRRLLCTLC